MNLCYLCGREMFDKKYYLENEEKFTENPALKHDEHIIQNSLAGKLKSNNILCETCGSKLNESVDKNFGDLFALIITEQLRKKNIHKERRNNSPTLEGYCFDKEKQKIIKVHIKDFKASPIKPFPKFDEENKIIKIYGSLSSVKSYKDKVISDLKNQGKDINSYKIQCITDISSDNDFFYLPFPEGNDNFNEILALLNHGMISSNLERIFDGLNRQSILYLCNSEIFRKGLNKIATGFAYDHGVKRSDLVRTLDITEGNEKIIDSDNIIPFFSQGMFDIFLDLHRSELENYYPTHTLILFTQKYTNNKKSLYCYIDLFSTFQYYVILNDNYEGEDIYEVYYQTVLKQEITKIDIRKVRPKHLNIIIEDFGIDRSKYQGSSVNDLYDFIEEEYKKLNPEYQINLYDELENIANKLIISYSVSQEIQLPMPNLPQEKVIQSFRNFQDLDVISFLSEIKHFLDKDNYIFRRCFYKSDENDEVEILSTPDEMIVTLNLQKSHALAQEYGNMKFQQLQNFANSIPKEDILHTLLLKMLYHQPISKVIEKNPDQVDIDVDNF